MSAGFMVIDDPGPDETGVAVFWDVIRARTSDVTTPPVFVQSKLHEETMSDERSIALPTTRDGRSYITDEMLEDTPELRELIDRTRASWVRDEMLSTYVMRRPDGPRKLEGESV